MSEWQIPGSYRSGPFYPPPQTPTTSPLAIAALSVAVVGWFFCPPVLGITALFLARGASKEIERSGGWLTGDWLVKSAKWVAWASIVFFAVVMVATVIFIAAMTAVTLKYGDPTMSCRGSAWFKTSSAGVEALLPGTSPRITNERCRKRGGSYTVSVNSELQPLAMQERFTTAAASAGWQATAGGQPCMWKIFDGKPTYIALDSDSASSGTYRVQASTDAKTVCY